MTGRGQPDLSLIGFSVDSPQPSRQATGPTATSSANRDPPPSRPPPPSQLRHEQHPQRDRESSTATTASAYSRPTTATSASSASFSRQGGAPPAHPQPPALQQSYSQPPPTQGRDNMAPRPSNASSTYGSVRQGSPPPAARGERKVSGPTAPPGQGSNSGGPRSTAGATPPPPRPLSAMRNNSVSAASGAPPMPGQLGGGLIRPPAHQRVASGQVSGAGAAARPSSLYNTAPLQAAKGTTAQTMGAGAGLGIGMGRIQSSAGGDQAPSTAPPARNRTMSGSSRRSVDGNAPPKGGEAGQTGRKPSGQAAVGEAVPAMPAIVPQAAANEEGFDDDTVLSNVEEMLEGFEWRGGGGSGWASGAIAGRGKADEIEKRLVGELKALEAVRQIKRSRFGCINQVC